MNKFLLGVIGLLLLLGLAGYCTVLSQILTRYANELITLAENVGILMTVVNGTFVSTRLFKVALFFVSLLALGIMFKIMHLPGADQLLLYPFIILFCLYFIHFLNKKSKRRVDVLKLVMLSSITILPPFIRLHIIRENHIAIIILISHVLFWLTFLDFLYTSTKQGGLLKR